MVGPSGSGKTTAILQAAEAWLAGQPVLGCQTKRPLVHCEGKCPEYTAHAKCFSVEHWKPGKILYLAADRGQKDTEETIDRVLGADSPLKDRNSGFEWKSILGHSGWSDLFLEVDHTLAVKVVIIEGAASLLSGLGFEGGINDNRSVSEFLKTLSENTERRNIAVVLVLHSPKTKRGEEYKNPRDRILGAISWGAYSSTVMVLSEDKPDDPSVRNRTLVILPRNYPTRRHHLTMTYEGRFIEIEPSGEPMKPVNGDQLMRALNPADYSREQMLEIGKGLGMASPTVDRNIRALRDKGKLTRKNDPENPRKVIYTILAEPEPVGRV